MSTAAPTQSPAAPARDPRKGLRGVGAGLLVLESFTVMFAMLAVFGTSNTDGHVAGTKLATLGGIAAALFVAGFLMRLPWGRALGTALQVVVLGTGGWIHPLLFVAVLFGSMWAVYLRMWRNLMVELGQVG